MLRKGSAVLAMTLFVASFAGCSGADAGKKENETNINTSGEVSSSVEIHQSGTATEITKQLNAAWYDKLDFSDKKEFVA